MSGKKPTTVDPDLMCACPKCAPAVEPEQPVTPGSHDAGSNPAASEQPTDDVVREKAREFIVQHKGAYEALEDTTTHCPHGTFLRDDECLACPPEPGSKLLDRTTTATCVCRLIQHGCKAAEHDYDPIPDPVPDSYDTMAERARCRRIIEDEYAQFNDTSILRAALRLIDGGDDVGH